MTENEVAQILRAIKSLEDTVENNHLEHRRLIIGNGDSRAILPRLQSLETIIKGARLLLPIVTALIIAGVMYAIFGTP